MSASSMPLPSSPFVDNRKPEAVEDCRDYLRTGRCKYGSSCKYNHPSNVQNGGGMKAPLDPTEPLFPIRPHEPVCQYYMKHATCKFGQACKFHHPPHHAATMHGVVGGGVGGSGGVVVGMTGGGVGPTTVLMNVGSGGRKIMDAHTQLILNPMGISCTADMLSGSGGAMMMQLLPQRPDEPDCIYFLKNGRCKYGATCRYHHPVNYHHQQQRRIAIADEQRQPRPGTGTQVASSSSQQQQHQQQDPYSIPFVQYVTHVPFPQGPVVVADGPLTFVSVDGSQTYKPVSLVPGGEGFPMYCPTVPGSTVATEQGSTTSSIASSYDTSNSSSLDHLAVHGDTSSAALWNRAKKNRSGGSLNAHVSSGGGGAGLARGTIPTVRSDGSIARRGRVGSYGSASDHGATVAHFDTNTGATISATSNVRTSSGNPETATMWRQDRSSSSFEPVRRMPTAGAAGHYVMESEGQQLAHHGRPPMRGAQPPRRTNRHGTRSRSGDEGFTRMTSALLNMLDTPEETSADMYSDEGSYRYGFDEPDDATRMLEGLSMQDDDEHNHHNQHHLGPPPPVHPHDGDGAQWSPTWHGSSAAGPGALQNDSRTMSNMHPSQQQLPPSPNSEHSDFVGLYLP